MRRSPLVSRTMIRTNRDGSPHLGDLRRALAMIAGVEVFRFGGGYTISRWDDVAGVWRETPLPSHMAEPEAILCALDIDW